ncbi:MAG: HAD family phosphatase [Gammaproteobacteria bacterium]|nr:HAD family phosphatase [Gammaproteobacteria bacterium]
MAKTKLIIFDCDGVLVDSESIVCRILAEEMNRYGMPTTAEEVDAQFSGRPAKDCFLEIEKRYGRPLPETYFKDTEHRIREAFHSDLEPVPGIEQILKEIKHREISSCVASSGSHEKMHLTLNKTKLYHYFTNSIFSAEDVARGKPWPDLFLHSARMFGVQPEHCLVVEDSVPGVKAAVAAGMPVVGYSPQAERGRKLKVEGAKVINEIQAVLNFL